MSIEEVLSRIDIVEVIGGSIALRRSGNHYLALCPFHQEKTPSFSVSPAKQRYHCFGCGAHGDAIQFLVEFSGLPFKEALETLAHRAGVVLPKTFNHEKELQNEPLYEVLKEAQLLFKTTLFKHPAGAAARDYIKSRGLTKAVIERFELGYALPGWDQVVQALGTDEKRKKSLMAAGLVASKGPDRFYDRFRDRIMFPIRTRSGRTLGFGGRIVVDGQPKYLNSPETLIFHKSEVLYGLYEAKQIKSQLPYLIVVEGYLDVISLSQFGITEGVGTLGTALSTRQLERLFQETQELLFCFDGDKAGYAAMRRALTACLPFMKEGRRVKFCSLPPHEDPDSYVRKMGKEGFLAYLEQAQSLSDFLFESERGEIDLTNMEGRATYATRLKKLIEQVPSGIFQQMLFNRLAEQSGLKLENLVLKQRNIGKPASKRSTPASRGAPMSAALKAVALLLEHRHLLRYLADEAELTGSESPDANLLCATIAILQIDPNISNTALENQLPREYVSQFTKTDFKALLEVIPLDGVEAEFLGAIERLKERAQLRKMEVLLMKAKEKALSQEEHQKLIWLLNQKEKINS